MRMLELVISKISTAGALIFMRFESSSLVLSILLFLLSFALNFILFQIVQVGTFRGIKFCSRSF